ncbi:MAG TPA: hypothetical protein VF902_05925 [Coriobacteriia bacterium]
MLQDALEAQESVLLTLEVRDPDIVRELRSFADPAERDRAALNALRIGVLALRQARGQIDADTVRNEGQRILEEMQFRLTAHQTMLSEGLSKTLAEYFDPASGRFSERVKRLVEKDGELERLLRDQLSGEDSSLGRTLAASVGERSPLMKVLSPNESEGLLASLRDTFDAELAGQREAVLRQFSLDVPDSALSRLVKDVTEKNGDLEKALKLRIDEVTREFSLDNEQSALARLVGRVDQAQKQITREFSLDDEASALYRMRKELLGVLREHEEANKGFQEDVKTALAAMSARKDERDQSTRHGGDFEDAVYAYLERDARDAGDVPSRTGETTGLIKNCKVGDCIVELGPERSAAGARIAVEAKEDASYDLRRALAEIETARKNRGAAVGLFVCSEETAKDDIPRFARYGDDIVVRWSASSEQSDVYLDAALSLARALATRGVGSVSERAADFEAIEEAILEVERRAQSLDEIATYAETIRGGAGKIVERVRITREALERQVLRLRDRVEELASDTSE